MGRNPNSRLGVSSNCEPAIAAAIDQKLLPWLDLGRRRRHRARPLRVRRHPPAGRKLRTHPRRVRRGVRRRPDRYDIAGALLCLAGVAVMMYAPRSA